MNEILVKFNFEIYDTDIEIILLMPITVSWLILIKNKL